MPHLFITRNLDADSPLKVYADKFGHEITAHSLLTFSPVKFTPPPRADAWFFYSSRAVEFSIDALEHVDHLPRIAAIGPGTAATLTEMGIPVDFVGNGDPVEVTQQFMEAIPKGKVFFPRARQSRRSVQRMLSDNYIVLDAICYDNVAVPDPTEVTADVYIFTSPLNAKTYLSHHSLPEGARAVAIGPSTGAALKSLNVPFDVAEEPSELGLLAVLRR